MIYVVLLLFTIDCMMKNVFLFLLLFVWTGASAEVPIIPLPKSAKEVRATHQRLYEKIEITSGFDDSIINTVIDEIREFSTGWGAFDIVIHNDENITNDEGYTLSLVGDKAEIYAKTAQGAFYALQSLKQLLRVSYPNNVFIDDHPDFARRIFSDDISHGPVPNIDFVKSQIRQLAELKYNYLSFYIEHVVKVESYPGFAPANGKFTLNDIREICAYAAKYNMQVIGNFQSFGQAGNVLSQPDFAHLGDSPSMYAPLNEDTRAFLRSVIEELCDVFSAPYFNINCNDIGEPTGRESKERVARAGLDRFYADHITFLYEIIKAKGKQTMLRGDVAVKYPSIIKLLPRDIIYLTQECEAQESFTPWIAPFSTAGARFMVCPGLLNSDRLFPDMRMARDNMRFIAEGHAAGAEGVMLTSWDNNAFHFFTPLWYGIYLGAEAMWNTTVTATKESFDWRFCLLRLDAENSNFTKTMDVLYDLAGIGITQQMNDRIFYENLLPIPTGDSLSYNLEELEEFTKIVEELNRASSSIVVWKNSFDVDVLRYTIAKYDFIALSHHVSLRVSEHYRKFLETGSREVIIAALEFITPLELLLVWLEDRFCRNWLTENQSYFLDRGLKIYQQKREQISRLRTFLLELHLDTK